MAVGLVTAGAPALADGSQPILTAGFTSGADGAKATMKVIQRPDGTVSGEGTWLYPDTFYNLYADVDQAYVSPDGLSISFSGWLTTGGGIDFATSVGFTTTARARRPST